MKLVVGLGNPGKKYDGTRHNVGYEVLEALATRHSAGKPKAAFQGRVCEISLAGEKTLLLWPETYMNLSGGSLLAARDFYKLDNKELLVVCDDFNLPLAKLRFRPAGSAGGQKGLEDVIRRLGTEEVGRLRFWIGPVPPGYDAAGFVLGRFNAAEAIDVSLAVDRAANAVADWVSRGIEYCMNQYN